MQGQRPTRGGGEINIATDTDSHSSNQDCYVTKTIKTRYQRKQNRERGGSRGEREKGGAGRTLKQKKQRKRKGEGGLSWRTAPSPPSQVGELGGFLNSSLRRMVGGKVRVSGVRLPWPGPVMVAAAQRPGAPVVHGGRGGVREVSEAIEGRPRVAQGLHIAAPYEDGASL